MFYVIAVSSYYSDDGFGRKKEYDYSIYYFDSKADFYACNGNFDKASVLGTFNSEDGYSLEWVESTLREQIMNDTNDYCVVNIN
jgi:hypothetical protein